VQPQDHHHPSRGAGGLGAHAVRQGIPIENLTSLAALLDPEVVGPVLEAYWQRNGKEPTVYTVDLGWKLFSLAKQIGLDEAAIERLDDIRAALEDHRHGGLTDKNLKLIRQVLTEGIWSEVVSLPNALMWQARADQAHAPVRGGPDRPARSRHRHSLHCAGPADQPRVYRTG
jgi:hypothetical protein